MGGGKWGIELGMAALRGISRLSGNTNIRGLLLGKPNPSFHLPSRLHPSRGIASKLFVGGLSFYTTEDSLSEAFSQFGQVVEAKIIMDRVSDRPKGFGFITFASQDEADRAVSEMNGKVLNGRVVYVDYAKAKSSCDVQPIARSPPQPPGNK